MATIHNTRPGRILLGMSGGLDSTYAAKLLKEQGWEVEGAVLRFSEETDWEAARLAAREVGLPLWEVDLRERFRVHVMDYFAEEYRSGRTPNPCVVCNRYVKMQSLYELSLAKGCDAFATGHYALPHQLPNGRWAIARARDSKKDQSYMLWGMTQEQIARFVAPLAELEKNQVREAARQSALSSAESRESQDICFIPDKDYISFIEKRYGTSKGGFFVTPEGKPIAPHAGLLHYTVGQRKGLGVALGYPAFITHMDPISGNITLAPANRSYFSRITVSRLSFQGLIPEAGQTYDLAVKIRYAAPPVPCRVTFEGDKAQVQFAVSQRTPAPGQSAVFYDGTSTAFGGFIEEAGE